MDEEKKTEMNKDRFFHWLASMDVKINGKHINGIDEVWKLLEKEKKNE